MLKSLLHSPRSGPVLLSCVTVLFVLGARTCLAQTPTVLAVTDSATFTPGLPETGSLATIFCQNLISSSGIHSAGTFPLPYTFAGVSVNISGKSAPILAVADFGLYSQVNIQVPDLDRNSLRTLVVEDFGHHGTFEWQLPSAWGVLFIDSSGYAIAQHTDYSPVTPNHPAHPGEVLIVYGTNLDAYTNLVNPPPIGFPASTDPLSVLRDDATHGPIFITVNGVKTEMLYVGLSPGLVGVFQLNFRVPTEALGGDAIVGVTAVGVGSVRDRTSIQSKLPIGQ